MDDDRLESLVDYVVGVAELVGRGELRAVDLYRLDAQVRLADYQNLEHVEGDLSDLDEQPARAAMASLSAIGEWRTAFVSSVLDRLEAAHSALDAYHAKRGADRRRSGSSPVRISCVALNEVAAGRR